MVVEVPLDEAENVGRADGFIEGLINVFLDTLENCRQQSQAPPPWPCMRPVDHTRETRKNPTPEELLFFPCPSSSQRIAFWRYKTYSDGALTPAG